jgi:hypothetical protein
MLSTKEELEALLRTLDVWVIVFGVFVAIGVAGESVVGFVHFRKSSQLHRLQTAENLAQQAEIERLRSESASIRSDTAKAIERAAHAEQQAAESNKIAEGERLARIKIEEKMADRHISPVQSKKMLDVLGVHPGLKVKVDSLLSEGREALAYALEIATVFHAAKWDVTDPAGRVGFSRPLKGVILQIKQDSPSDRELALIVAKAFQAADIPVSGNIDANLDDNVVFVLVGSK